MNTVLLLYSTTDGQTRRIGERLKATLETLGHEVTLVDVLDDPGVDPATFDKVVIGAGIRYGRHSPRITTFIRQHGPALSGRPGAFFSVNLVARKPGRNQPTTNPYLKRFLQHIPWKPTLSAAFAGKLDYPCYGFLDRLIIRLIMAITGGPTDPSAVIEFTDWQQVDAFGRLIAAME